MIAAQSAVLAERMAGARDYKDAERAHRSFLDALVTQAFLDVKQIMTMLEAIFVLTHRLCGILQVSVYFKGFKLFSFPGRRQD